MKLIDRIQITLEPWRYTPPGDGTQTILRVSVRTMGEEFHSETVMYPDQFASDFDRIFDCAKHDLLKHIMQQRRIQEQIKEPAVTP